MKRFLTASFALLFAAAMCIPAIAAAEDEKTDQPDGAALASQAPEAAIATDGEDDLSATLPEETAALSQTPLAHMQEESTAGEAAEERDAPSDGTADQVECHLTITYIELLNTDDPMTPLEPHEMGTYVVSGLHPGDVVNVWDYVFDIPGHFFFDGSSPSITISADDSKNTVELVYGVLQNSEFTVDYYIMDGADLTASDWAGALATDPSFYKIGEQKFVNQSFNKEVNGADFEYALEGLYPVGAYPESIHLTESAEDNVISVVYVPAISDLPESWEVIDKPQAPDASEPGTDAPEKPTLPNEVLVPTPSLPDSADPGSFGIPSDGIQGLEGVVISDGNVNAHPTDGPLVITEEMLDNPVTPQTAERYAQAYDLDTPLVSALPAVTTAPRIQVGLALLLFLMAFLAVCAYAFERGEQGK